MSLNPGTIVIRADAGVEIGTGLSDHSVGIAVPAAAVALGACIIEKHLTLSRSDPGPDSAFSLEPQEFGEIVKAVQETEKALGLAQIGPTAQGQASRAFRRSLFVVADMKRGEVFSPQNVRSIRPGNGLHTRYLPQVIGKRCTQNIERGTPLGWGLVERP